MVDELDTTLLLLIKRIKAAIFWESGMRAIRDQIRSLFLLRSSALTFLTCQSSLFLLFAVYVLYRDACRATFPAGISAIISAFHHILEQPIGTLSLWNDPSYRHRQILVKPEYRAQRRYRSLVFISDLLNYNILKGCYGILAQLCQSKLHIPVLILFYHKVARQPS